MDILVSIISIVSNLTLGGLVFKNNKSNTINRLFLLLCLGFSGTIFFQTFYNSISLSLYKLIFIRLIIFFASFTGIIFLYFAKSFPNINNPFTKRTNIILISISVFIMSLDLTPLVFSNFDNGNLEVGPLIPLYLLHLLSCLFIGLATLISKNIKYKGKEKQQIKFITIGLLSTFLIIIVSDIIFPIVFNILSIQTFGNFAPLIFSTLTYYSIIRHRLLDINLAIRKFLIISVIILFFYFSSVLSYYFFHVVIKISSNTDVLSTIIPISFFVIIYNPINKLITTIIDKFLFNKLIDRQKAIKELDKTFSNDIDLNKLLNDIKLILQEALGISDIKILLFQEGNIENRYQTNFDSPQISSIFKEINIYQYLRTINAPILIEEIPSKEINKKFKNQLRDLNVSVIIPLQANKQFVGVFILGQKNANDFYTVEDLNLLEDFGNRAGISIYNSMLYQQLQNFNKELSVKVDSATAQLRAEKEKVEDRYRTERDMIGIMGHELRTPLTSARGFLEIIMTKAKNNPDTPVNTYQHYLDNVYDAFKREIDLVQTMLSTSHVDNGKLNLDLVEVDLDNVIKGAMIDFGPEAQKKNLGLEYHPFENIPHIKMDPSRTIEVVNNLISNGIKYTDKGKVDVLVSYDDQYVYYSVKDTGKGIPENEIPNIGKKFYRIENYLSKDNESTVVRPGGTGLGMYIVKAILVAAGGELRIQSILGQGSTFTAVFQKWTTNN